MKPTQLLPILSLPFLGLSSCSSVRTTMQKMSEPVGTFAKAGSRHLRDLRLPGFQSPNSKIPPVVKVRREDLRKVQLGSEKVLAWTRSKQDGGGVIYFPVDFDPSKLPVGGQLPSSGILPPLNPGSQTDTGVPADITNLPDLSSSDFEGTDRE